MYTLASDEKVSGVMIYTQNTLVYGEAVTKTSTRVSVWLRTEGAPEYIHLLNPQVIYLSGSTPRRVSYSEIYVPAVQIIGFHLAPPAHDPLDYDESEMNRKMQSVFALVGSFVFSGAIRISTQVDLGTSITSGRAVWMSIYNVTITNPLLAQFGEVQVPMLVIRPGHVNFALNG
jgi:hypothetical protein